MRPLSPLTWFAYLLFVLALEGCQREPRPINLASDTCAFCRMGVGDPKFAGELVTGKGKIITFDSIECLAAYVLGNPDPSEATAWVSDFNRPGEWLKAENAFFIRSPQLRSPMGLNLAAYKTRAEFEKALGETQGAELRWQDVMLLVRTSGFAARGQDHAHRASPP